MMERKFLLAITFFLATLSCARGQLPTEPVTVPPGTMTSTTMPVLAQTPLIESTLTSTPTELPSETPVPSPTLTPQPTATLEPYEEYTIEHLRARSYGGGVFEIAGVLAESDSFTRYAVRYTSDELYIYAIMTVPAGDGPFPVIILLHGYDWPSRYNLYDEALDTDDGFAGEGYLVLRPAMRNYAPSDAGDNLFRVGIAVDVLNLIGLVKSQGGKVGPLVQANPNRIGLWGFSMGGGVALRVLTISSDVDAAMLYAPVSGDESKNRNLFHRLSTGYDTQFNGEGAASEAQLELISPSYYYSSINTPLLIFHGTADSVVPVDWTVETCELIATLAENPECIFYDGAGHSFVSRYLEDMMPRMYDFYDRYLRQ
ncbi:MAG: prolyl oligopeptidase family serine peptidase [Chloroflexota bacterium]